MQRIATLSLAVLAACTTSGPAGGPQDAMPDSTPTITAADGTLQTLVSRPINGVLHASSTAGGKLLYKIVDPPVHGNIQLTDDVAGTFTYTPDATGSFESFTFLATDLEHDSNVAKVAIEIDTASNDQLVLAGPTTDKLPEGYSSGIATCVTYTVTRVGHVGFLAQDTSVSISSGSFAPVYRDAQCSDTSASLDGTVVIAAGQDRTTFSMRLQKAGPNTLTAAATGFIAGTLVVTVTPGYAARIQLAAAPATAVNGKYDCVPVTMSFFDWWNNPTVPGNVFQTYLPLAWTYSGTTAAAFYRDNACTQQFPKALDTNDTDLESLAPATTLTFYVTTFANVQIRTGLSWSFNCGANAYATCSNTVFFP